MLIETQKNAHHFIKYSRIKLLKNRLRFCRGMSRYGRTEHRNVQPSKMGHISGVITRGLDFEINEEHSGSKK